MSKLVIVESPAKAKTIKKYLGKNYEVVASMGHVRDLPKFRLNVNIKKNFQPTYKIISGKEKIVDELCKKAKKSETVFLAPDPDREGEAISWHLAYLLSLGVNEKNRVTFSEITKNGIIDGMKNSHTIDMDLVNAQQARRVLDRVVGYKLSPFLSKKICKGLSAGRVQSVAVRIIVDREEEIRKFVSQEYWSIEVELLLKGSKNSFVAVFYGDKENNKIEILNETQAKEILDGVNPDKFEIFNIKTGKRKKNPPKPLITSTLQQEAAKQLGFKARRTMKVAQELYEGVNIDKLGAVGLITYIRTDSLRLSEDALKGAREYILKTYGEKYLPAEARRFKSKNGAQDAHEAIRPTMPDLTPQEVKKNLTADQFKLYNLIWECFTAGQMTECIHKTTQIDVNSGNYLFKASGFIVEFDGFTVLYNEKNNENDGVEKALPKMNKDTPLKLKKITPNQHFTMPPPRFTEAALIKALEKYGIGRPSTYAPTISTITMREYVIREANAFKPTELGETVVKLMKEHFPKIVDLKFTAKMESELDIVEKGKIEWQKVLEEFYGDFAKTLEKAAENMKNVKIALKEDETDTVCELCGKKMVVRRSRFGKFIGCSGFPECKNTKKLLTEIDVKCPKCQSNITKKKSKKGRFFFGCSNYPQCDFVSWNEPLNKNCPNCGKILFKKNAKKPKIYCDDKNCGYEEFEENFQ